MDRKELRAEIARLQDSLLLYDRVIPVSSGAARDQFVAHRIWDAEILGNLMRRLVYGPSGYPAG